MSSLAQFLEQLLVHGEVIFREPPRDAPGDAQSATDVLRRAHRTCSLEIAGPAVPFQEKTALASAQLMRRACWFLLDRRESGDTIAQALALPPAQSPADHLAADLVLRYAPFVLKRARALAADDPLAVRLTRLLREWPLSGVLADVADRPLSPIAFGGHAGLLMLYAERLLKHLKPAWVPNGPAYEYVELVFREAGKPVPQPWPIDQGAAT